MKVRRGSLLACLVKLFVRRWYDFGMFAALVALAYLAFAWRGLDTLVILQLLSFAALNIHKFEEYRFPGGEPAVINIAYRKSDMPDRYSLNQFSAMLVNATYVYIFYLLPVFLSHVIWLGLMPMLFGFTQVLGHGIVANKTMKTFYNPGLGACLLLHLPIGIYYIYYVVANNLAKGWDWLIAVVYMVAATWVTLLWLTYKVLPNRNTKWVFDKAEMERFNVAAKMAAIRK